MKSLVGRRIILIMSLAITVTSILISALGLYLAEDVFSFLRGQELVPDLDVLGELSLKYMDGDLGSDIYEAILEGSENQNNYLVIDHEGKVIYRSMLFPVPAEKVVRDNQLNILKGRRVFKRIDMPFEKIIELVGIPVIKDEEVIGGVFVATALADLSEVRGKFLRSLFLAMFIVMIFVIIITNYALRQIIKPIRNVMKVALAMVEGDFDIRADESTIGEIGLVGKTLNTLSLALYRNVYQLYIEKSRLDHVLNSLEEGMLALDEHMRITHLNQVMIQMFNLPEGLNRSGGIDAVPVVADFMDGIRLVLDAGRSMDEKAVYGDRIYRILSESIEDEKGTRVGAVILVRDITEMENLENTRKNYVANVSHELRSPLTSVRGLIEPLMDGIVTDEKDRQRYYGIIYQESLRLSRLVDDIMELSRLQTSDVVIDRYETDLSPLLAMVYEKYRNIDDRIELAYDPTALPRVLTNEDRIEQILVILLDNAYKFTEAGGTITIGAEVSGDHVVVSVADNGIGIAKEDLPYIFDRFYKTDKSRTKKSTGLGLSIAKEIMELMGEKITCKSSIGKGSTFSFTIAKTV